MITRSWGQRSRSCNGDHFELDSLWTDEWNSNKNYTNT